MLVLFLTLAHAADTGDTADTVDTADTGPYVDTGAQAEEVYEQDVGCGGKSALVLPAGLLLLGLAGRRGR